MPSSLGDTVQEREDMLKRGGLTIQTAIDPQTQDLAQKKVSSVVGAKDPLISTMNMIQPGTGLIVASAQSRPVMGSDKKKGQTYWNLSAPSELGGIQGYQAGSTFKAFTIAAALEKGIPISKKFNARSPLNFGGRSYSSCDGKEHVYGSWRVKNSVGHSHTIGMTEAAEWSVNTYFVQLELAAGMCNVTKMAQKAGVEVGHRIGAPAVDIVKEYQDKPSFTLGTVEVSPLSMAEAYATFASGGIHCDPIIVSKITTRTGKNLAVPSANCKRVMDADVANGVSKVLKSVITKGTGTRALVGDGRDQAGKTGTIDSAEAVWFAGYTPEIAGVAMISVDGTKKPFIKGRSGFRSHGVTGYRVPSTGRYLEGSGSGDSGALIWKPVMAKYFENVPRTKFEDPPSRIEVGKKVDVPYVGNLSLSDGKKKLEKEGFTVIRSYEYSSRTRGSFLYYSPNAGSRVSEFSTVYQVFSKGKDPSYAKAKAKAKKAAAKKKADAKKKGGG
jgi:membrane peptidoglycan carboxypeptidase